MGNLRSFPDRKVQGPKKPATYYSDGDTSHQRRKKIAKEIAGNCWWLETYLMMNPNIIKK